MNPLPENLTCDACGARPGEWCRPDCIGEAAWIDHMDAAIRGDKPGTPAGDPAGHRVVDGPGALWDQATAVSVYTRQDALNDGTLVAAPGELAREAGFRVHLAFTATAWADCVAWSEQTDAQKPYATGQDETGRLWDVLTMARHAAAHAAGANRVPFTVLRVPATGRGLRPRGARLLLHIGPGDDHEPVATITLPGED